MNSAHGFFIADVPSAIVCVFGAIAQILLGRRLRFPAALNYPLACGLLILYFTVREVHTARPWGLFSPAAHTFIPPALVLWFFTVLCTAILFWIRIAVLRSSRFSTGRRTFLRTASAAVCAVPAAAMGAAVILRKNVQVHEIEVAFPELPQDLHGLRLVQLSDIHLGAFFNRKDLARVIDESNNLRGHLVFITGDLITTPWDPLDECIYDLRRLRSDAGIWGCMGNHEMYCGAQAHTEFTALRHGIKFLRHEAASARFGSSSVNLVGVDYQPIGDPYLRDVEQLVSVDSFNLLLSHNPDVFPTAARKGFDLTLAGHTHGGQINLEILGSNLNLPAFYTPFTKGLYSGPLSSVYVNSGLGTIGVPARLGAHPEIALIKLVRG